jgi:two-component system sensor histidine kinase DegS
MKRIMMVSLSLGLLLFGVLAAGAANVPRMDKDQLKALLGKPELALVDVRSSVAALRTIPDENLPLPDMIGKLLENCNSMDLETSLKVNGSPRPLSAQVHLTLYRAAQESINNICKHSKASQVWVSLDYLDDQNIRLMVQDNGIGAEHIEGGYGLLGVRERVNLLNGELKIQTERDQGFRLEVTVPE